MLMLCNAGFTQAPRLSTVSGRLRPGELLAIVGPNGAGKSTLLSMLTGYRHPDQGRVYLDRVPLDEWPPETLARRRALVAQTSPMGFDWPVSALVGLGCDTPQIAVVTVLDMLGLTALAERSALSLSGGEYQRVMIARALCQLGVGLSSQTCHEGKILLLDEPTSALDLGQQQRVMRLLRNLAERHAWSICCVLHDLNLAACYAHRVWLMNEGQRIAAGTSGEVLNQARVANVFGVDLAYDNASEGAWPRVLLAR